MRPEDLHPAERRRQRLRRDLAYGAYLYLGLMLAAAFLLSWLPVTLPGYSLAGELLGTPALILAVPAGLVALVYTAVARREHALRWLALLVVAAWPVLWLAGRLPCRWRDLGGVFFGLATAALLVLPLRWFAGGRRPWRRALPGEPEPESRRSWG